MIVYKAVASVDCNVDQLAFEISMALRLLSKIEKQGACKCDRTIREAVAPI
jgi:hypothetical protein